MIIKKNKGPKTDPWGTPAEIPAKDEDWSFKTTLWYLLFKKLSISFNGVSDIPNDLILHNNPSCQTLSNSKALEMSKTIPLTSKWGLQSNDLWLPWTIESSWYSHESEGLKPGWASLRSFFQ